MKILMLTTQLGYGGAETSFIRLANFLSQSMEVKVALFTRDYGKSGCALEHEPLQAEVIVLDDGKKSGRLRRWWQRLQMMRRLKQQHDITISFLSGPNIVSVLAGHNEGTIISLRGSRIYDPVIAPWMRWVFQYVLDPIVFRRAAAIVAVSAGLKNEIKYIAGDKALEKTHIIPPFVNAETLKERLAESPPEKFAALAGQKVIVSVGRLSVEKGFQHLIRVFAMLSANVKGVKLLLVGDGPMQSSLRALCVELGLEVDNMRPEVTSVLFAGYQPNTLPLTRLGTVYAMTSATEGLPNVVLEAMAAGVPVIAADTPWGARAILSKQTAHEERPYPTTQATKADYGTLMPRIDLPEYHAEWTGALADALVEPNVTVTQASRRVQDFDLAIVGMRWVELIDKLRVQQQAEEYSSAPLLLCRIANRIGHPLGINPFPRAFHYRQLSGDHKTAFEEIYQGNFWGSEQSRSGVGSELKFTQRYRSALKKLIQKREFHSLFDAPCGDLSWMPSLLQELSIDYQGGDISVSLVEEMKNRHPQYAIHHFDICKDPFPKADLWHCRDCLFHLPFAEIEAALRNFIASDIPYALLTTHRAFLLHRNLDLKGIGFRLLDLERLPISLPPPLVYLPDYRRGKDFPRYIGLWSRAMIKTALEAQQHAISK